MWKATERKKALPPARAPRRRGLVAAGGCLLLIPLGWLGFGTGDGTLATLAKFAFFTLATLTGLAFAIGRRRP